RIARRVESLGGGAGRHRRYEGIKAGGHRAHVGTEGAPVRLGGKIVHGLEAESRLHRFTNMLRILSGVLPVEIAMEGRRLGARHRISGGVDALEGRGEESVLDPGTLLAKRLGN